MILVADSHIGSGADYRLADQESSWRRVCITAAETGCTVIHAGDVFDRRRPTIAEMRAFQSGLDILREGGSTLLIALGNHDRVGPDDPTGVEAACAGYDAHVLRHPQVIETGLGAIGFLPWAPVDPGVGAKATAEGLLVLADELVREGARALVGHWALSGGALPSGLPLLELAEPILDSHALAALGCDFVAMGHIHKPQVVIAEPAVFHIGPLCRYGFSEASVETRGCQVTRDGDVLRAEWFEVPDRAYVTVDTDVRDAVDVTAELIRDIAANEDAISDGIVRIRWEQRSDQTVDTIAILTALSDAGAYRVAGIEPIVERIRSTRNAAVTAALDPPAAFDAWLDSQTGVAAPETIERVRTKAHERLGGAAC